MRSFILFISLILSLLTGAEPALSAYRVHEKRTALPHGWGFTRRCDALSTIPLRIALKQRHVDDIEAYLHDVSHPNSPNYGKHWSAGDIARTFAPTNETVDIVRNWLVTGRIAENRISLSWTKGWLGINVTVEEAERLMNTEYNVYTHMSGKQHVACEVYHLPEHVQPHVDFVTPSVHFDAKLTRRSGVEHSVPALSTGGPRSSVTSSKSTGIVTWRTDDLKHCDKHITPICLRTLYGLFYKPVATDKNSYGIVEYSPETYLQSDLEMFARNFSTDLVGKKPRLVSIDGGYVQTVNQSFKLNAEPDLDLQYGMSMVTGDLTVTLFQAGDIQGASFNDFLDAIDGSYCTFEGGDDPDGDGIYPDTQPGGYTGPKACGTVDPTYVISTSYSIDEAGVTPFYAERQCNEYAKLGLMGITILYSSGDHGVAGVDNTCLGPHGTGIANGDIFNPGYPGTCPYVTVVGATMVRPNGSVFEPETACAVASPGGSTYSSGGFSNYFTIPDYQKVAVGRYLRLYPPNYSPKIWNSTGMSRAYPDISANGVNYVVVVDGRFRSVFGTSCSTPVVGAMFAMINDARLAVNKSTIGFVNPAIYSAEFAGAFHDITNGTNPGCSTEGFNATIGWDPVTGLGTPNFPALLELWLALP